MPERWIIYRVSRVKYNVSFYTGKHKDEKKKYIIFRRNINVSFPQWISKLEDKSVVIFKSYEDAVKEKKSLFLSQRGYKYGIDMHPKDRYDD